MVVSEFDSAFEARYRLALFELDAATWFPSLITVRDADMMAPSYEWNVTRKRLDEQEHP